MTLFFNASLVSDRIDDKLRNFIVSYYKDDSSFSVTETEVCNSGFPAGKLIGKRKFTNPDTGNYFTPDEVMIGQVINLDGFKFKIEGATPGTLNMMEADPDTFSKSDLSKIMLETSKDVKYKVSDLKREFENIDKSIHKGFTKGRVTFNDARKIFDSNNLYMDEQTRLTVLRRYQFADVEDFMYNDFLKEFSN